jgi:FHA domain
MLRTAYADGLMSESTFSHRLEALLSHPLVDPGRLVGDLSARSRTRRWSTGVVALGRRAAAWLSGRPIEPPVLLGLDWDGASEPLVIGREPDCDVVLPNATVSRRHARLDFRDGRWILCDLASTNGTMVNRAPVGRCELRPGDRVLIGGHELLVD